MVSVKCPHTVALFHSLLAMALSYDPVGWCVWGAM